MTNRKVLQSPDLAIPIHSSDGNEILPPQILRLPAVLARTGFAKSWIYREIAAGRFPAPVKIGVSSGWNAALVSRWVEERLEPKYPM